MYTLMNRETEIEINGKRITIKEYKGYRVVTLADIDGVHGRKSGTARKRFNKNKEHLIIGVDYFVLNKDEAKKEFNIIAPNGLILLTESGYLMLVKSFRDELAWQVQRQLIKGYFRAVQIQKEETQQQIEEDKYSIFKISTIVKAIMGICEAVYLNKEKIKELNEDNEKLKEENKKLKEKSQMYYEDIYFLKEEVKVLNKEIERLDKEDKKLMGIIREIQGYLFS